MRVLTDGRMPSGEVGLRKDGRECAIAPSLPRVRVEATVVGAGRLEQRTDFLNSGNFACDLERPYFVGRAGPCDSVRILKTEAAPTM